jgi:hypothetical protein
MGVMSCPLQVICVIGSDGCYCMYDIDMHSCWI